MTTSPSELLDLATYHAEKADALLNDYAHGDPEHMYDDPTSTEVLLRAIALATTAIAQTLIARSHHDPS